MANNAPHTVPIVELDNPPTPRAQVAEPKGVAVTPLVYRRRPAAQSIGISASMLDLLVKRGEIRPAYCGRVPLFPLEELQRFLREKQEAQR